MQIIVDTSVLVALLNPSDQNHSIAERHLKALPTNRAVLIPRIARIEFIGHVTRWRTTKDNLLKKLDELERIGWAVEEHTSSDYLQADTWWKQYTDWPIDYPDAVILATTVRLNVKAVWLFDKSFSAIMSKVAPTVKPIGSGFAEWTP